MVCTVEDVIGIMEEIAPRDYAEDWDNVGLLVGSMGSKVKRIMVVLDVTSEIVDEAIDKNVNMIIAHHPIIFNPIKRVIDTDLEGHLIMKLLSGKISLLAAHTNLDMAQGGIDDALANTLGLKNIELLTPSSKGKGKIPGFGRWGDLESPMELKEFGEYAKARFPDANIKIVGDQDRTISRVASCAGSGGDFIDEGKRVGAHIFVTGEMKYHQTLAAYMEGMCVMTLGHYHSEMPGIKSLTRRLQTTMDSLQYKVEIIGSKTRENPYPGIFIN